MDHHRCLFGVVLCCVFQLKALRQVVVNLDRTQLPFAADGILDHEVELRTIEGSLAGLLMSVESLLLARLANSVLALLPDLVRADILLGVLGIAQRDLCIVVVEAEDAEDLEDDVDDSLELSLHLVGAHEDMCVVLCEGTHTCESVELTALLIAEDSTELSDAERQVFVRAWLACVDLTVMRAVHWLEHVLLILLRRVDRLEGILAVVGVVSRGDIEVFRADARSDDLLIVVRLEHATKQLLQAQTQLCALRQPDGQTLADAVGEHEEFHFLADLAVVTLLGLFKHDEILVEHLLLGEGDAVDTCHLLALGIAAPESTCYAGDLDSFDGTRAHQVRTTAEVCEVALGVCSDGTVSEILLNVLHLIFLSVSLKLLDGVGFGYLTSYDGLVFLGKFLHLLLDLGEVVFGDHLALRGHDIIEEAVLDSRAKAELYAGVELLQCLGEQMGRSVPEGVLALFVVELVKSDGCVLVDRTVQLGCLTIDPARYNVAGESR